MIKPDRIVSTTCPYCGVGCGIDITYEADGAIRVRGDKEHPANFGRLCSKGLALGETLDLDDRLLRFAVDNPPDPRLDMSVIPLAPSDRLTFDIRLPGAAAGPA